MKKQISKIALGLLALNISTTSPVFSQSVKESEDGHSCTDKRSGIKEKYEKDKPKGLCLIFNYTPTVELSNPNEVRLAEQFSGFQNTELTNEGFYSDDCYRDGEKWYCPSCRRFHTCFEFKNYPTDKFRTYNKGSTFYYRYKCLDRDRQQSKLSKAAKKLPTTWEYPQKAFTEMTNDELEIYFACTCCGSELQELLDARKKRQMGTCSSER